eukprot:3901013-Amphidinium_carterae.1
MCKKGRNCGRSSKDNLTTSYPIASHRVVVPTKTVTYLVWRSNKPQGGRVTCLAQTVQGGNGHVTMITTIDLEQPRKLSPTISTSVPATDFLLQPLAVSSIRMVTLNFFPPTSNATISGADPAAGR